MARAFLLLGTNQGDLHCNLKTAVKKLQDMDILVIQKSRVSKTKPWGKTAQPDFLNIALEVETSYEPFKLLSVLKLIEREMGRNLDQVRWGPRIIDIDILFYGDRVIQTQTLTIPHREFLNRPFAIRLLAEIAPGFIHPGTRQQMYECVES